jgi:hypothetical protein
LLRLEAAGGGGAAHCTSEDEAEIETDEAHSGLKFLKPAKN